MAVYRHLDNELDKLRTMLVEMTDLVDAQLSDTANALLGCDISLAEQVLVQDNEIDAMELAIDHQCERILALQQPVAVDLRLLIAAAKINKDLERIGDQCKNIAKTIGYIHSAPETMRDLHLGDMADLSRTMLRRVQDAFVKQDRLLARQVIAQDQQVDRLHEANFQALIAYGKQHPEHLEAVAHLFSVTKALERIADHAKNIGEDVVFLIDAIDIRHRELHEEEDNPARQA